MAEIEGMVEKGDLILNVWEIRVLEIGELFVIVLISVKVKLFTLTVSLSKTQVLRGGLDNRHLRGIVVFWGRRPFYIVVRRNCGTLEGQKLGCGPYGSSFI